MDKKSRVALQFNEYDFRHRKTLEILRARPRHMTEIVVNAILHYVTCPDAGNELSKEWVRDIVREELAELLRSSQSVPEPPVRNTAVPQICQEDMADLSDVMGMFRRGD